MIRCVPYIPLRTPYSMSSVIITFPYEFKISFCYHMHEWIHSHRVFQQPHIRFLTLVVPSLIVQPDRVYGHRKVNKQVCIICIMHYLAWDRVALFEQHRKTVAPKFPFASLELEPLLNLGHLFNILTLALTPDGPDSIKNSLNENFNHRISTKFQQSLRWTLSYQELCCYLPSSFSIENILPSLQVSGFSQDVVILWIRIRLRRSSLRYLLCIN